MEIHSKLKMMGLDVPKDIFYTSAHATAAFLKSQNPKCTAFVIGAAGLKVALEEAGITATDSKPDYVIIGENDDYSGKQVTMACNFVRQGAKLIGTNADLFDPVEHGLIEPSCGAWISVIEKATGKNAYFVGKPNPIIMRNVLKKIGLHSLECAMLGDRMDTDIIGGIEADVDSVLLLSGAETLESMKVRQFQPYLVLDHVGDIVPEDFKG